MTEAQRDVIATPAIGLEIYNTDENEKQIYDGLIWTSVGSGNSFWKVNEVAHGRAIGFPLTPVYLDTGIWTDAQADVQNTLGTHVIIQVIDVDNFIIGQSGRYKAAAHGLTVESHYFVSELVAGALTLLEPPVFSNPIVFVEDANIIHISPFRAFSDTGSATPGTVSSVFGRAGNVIAVAGDYTASEVTNVPAGNIAAIEVQAALDELDTEKQPLNAELTGLGGLATNGLLVRTGAGAYTPRSLTAASTKVTLVNADGVAGNPSIDVDETNIDHDNLLNFLANEHIDWTSTAQNLSTTGTLASGDQTVTGNILVSGTVDGRDIALDGTKLDGIEALADVTDTANVDAAGAVMDTDFGSNGLMARTALGAYVNRSIVAGSTKILTVDGDGVAGNPSIDVDESQITLANLIGYDANAFVDHTTVDIDVTSTDDGLLGGGDISATRTLRVDVNSLVLEPGIVLTDEIMFYDLGAGFLRKTTPADILALATPVGQTNTASNVGVGAGVFESKVGSDLQMRSLNAATARMSVVQNALDISFDVVPASIDITTLGGFNANNYIDHTLFSITGGVGLNGGGSFAASTTIDMDIPSLVDEATIDNTDTVVIYDQSAGNHREMTRANFLTGIVAAPVDDVFGRTGNVVAAASDYDAVQVDNTPAGTIAAVDVQAAINELDGDIVAVDGAKEDTITGGATTITGANLTINRALVSDGSGKVAVSASTSAEVGHLSGVTSAIQTQLDAKLTFPEFIVHGGTGNVGGNSTVAVSMGSNAANGGLTALRNGEIYGISVRINNTWTAGVLTASALINGTIQNGVGEETTIDVGNTQGNFQVIATPIQYNAGDNLAMQTVTVAFTPTGADAVVLLYIRDR